MRPFKNLVSWRVANFFLEKVGREQGVGASLKGGIGGEMES